MNRTSIPKNGLRQVMARQRAQNRRTRRFRSIQQALTNAGFTIRMPDEVDAWPSNPPNLAVQPVEPVLAPIPAQNLPEAAPEPILEPGDPTPADTEVAEQVEASAPSEAEAHRLAEKAARERAKRSRYNEARKAKRAAAREVNPS